MFSGFYRAFSNKRNPYLFLKFSLSLICSSSFMLRLSFPNCKDRAHIIDTTIDFKVYLCCYSIMDNILIKKKTQYVC